MNTVTINVTITVIKNINKQNVNRDLDTHVHYTILAANTYNILQIKSFREQSQT